jgi:hypothetical protein
MAAGGEEVLVVRSSPDGHMESKFDTKVPVITGKSSIVGKRQLVRASEG